MVMSLAFWSVNMAAVTFNHNYVIRRLLVTPSMLGEYWMITKYNDTVYEGSVTSFPSYYDS